MLKKRIIPIMLYDSGKLVKSVQFSNPRIVGDPLKSAQVYSDQDADELLVLNVGSKKNIDEDYLNIIDNIAKFCHVPLSIGGGINKFEDAKLFFDAGADKIVINSTLYSRKNEVERIINSYGSQSVIGCVDVKKNVKEEYILFSHNGTKLENLKLEKHLSNLIDIGIGEILIQSIDRDGSMQGFDYKLIERVMNNVEIPVISAGGAGSFKDLLNAFEIGVDAVGCGSLFNFGDNSPLRAKSFLKNYNVNLKFI